MVLYSLVQESKPTDTVDLKHIEYFLLEALKQKSYIEVSGEISDGSNRKIPKGEIEVFNEFGREFLEQTLPYSARFDPNSGMVQIRTDKFSNQATDN